MTTHELAIRLLQEEDVKVTISINLDDDDNDEGKRAFSLEIWSVERNTNEVMIIADGITNFEYIKI